MNKEIITKRIKAIRRELRKQRIDCLIITSPPNVTYTTGFMGSDSWALITKRQTFLVTDSRYTEQAQKECVGCRIIRRNDSEFLAQAASKLLRKLRPVRMVAVEKSTSFADFELLKKYVEARLITIANVIETVRSSKDSTELTCIRRAASIAAKALQQSLHQVKPGITENELAGLLDFQIRRAGATNSFDTIVAFGANASRPHHQPGKKKLKPEDTILIDFGAKYKGYCCDITRCFAICRSKVFYKKVYDVVEQAQAAAIKMVKAGIEIGQVDAAAREVIRRNDLPVYGHGTGHGLGLEIHEAPFLKANSKGRLRTGEVITIEPGVYIPGKLGVRIEDDVLVTRTGCEILTRGCSHSLSVG